MIDVCEEIDKIPERVILFVLKQYVKQLVILQSEHFYSKWLKKCPDNAELSLLIFKQ